MKKIVYSAAILLLTILKLNNYSGALTDEINIYSISRLYASNLYNTSQSVSANDINVLDYEIIDQKLYITPASKTIILPIDGIITEVGDNYLILESSSGKYTISNISNRQYNLYQFYFKNTILGFSDKYIIEGDDYQVIVSNLIISYETI